MIFLSALYRVEAVCQLHQNYPFYIYKPSDQAQILISSEHGSPTFSMARTARKDTDRPPRK
ncbi:hypothetical protein M408DRAFT_129047 [Serendipita vermifera MAFF 305830]|uniref:Uncharacterized protein n=1 Tax=Serendipita vermifera MAFF 305830 TaxID=933852 RepID=A0A0C3AN15_SERVB|nr:hypothetical protein M408DRAFT_129047 [Serendipita vermifera MAFF 305830]